MEDLHFENEYTKMTITEGVLIIVYKEKLKITLDIAKQCVQDRIKFCKGESYPMVAALGDIHEPDQEAKKYLSSHEAMEGISAGAFIVKNHLYRLIGSVFIGLYVNLTRNSPPAKLFSNYDSAIAWARKYAKEEK
jgi:hypothetical protein